MSTRAFGVGLVLVVLAAVGTWMQGSTTINGDRVLSGQLTVSGHTVFEGVTSTGATGTGNIVYSGSPTLVTPALGTPSALNCTNCTNIPGANVTGTIGNGQYFGVLGSTYVATDQSTASQTYTDLATADSVTFTLAATTSVLVLYKADTYNTTAAGLPSNFDIINVDGSDVSGTDCIVNFQNAATANLEEPTVCMYKSVSLASGAHTVKIRHKTNLTTTGHWLNRLTWAEGSP